MYPDCPASQEELLSHHCLTGWDPRDRLNLVVEIARYVTTICRHHAGLPDGHPRAIGVSRGRYEWVCWLEILVQIQRKYGLNAPESFSAGLLFVAPQRPGGPPLPRVETLAAYFCQNGDAGWETMDVDDDDVCVVPRRADPLPTASAAGGEQDFRGPNTVKSPSDFPRDASEL